MAGRIKHMERSHRSYNKSQYIFSSFQAKAYKTASLRSSKKSLAQRFKDSMAPLKDKLRDAYKQALNVQ